jgi:hypothetical protein
MTYFDNVLNSNNKKREPSGSRLPLTQNADYMVRPEIYDTKTSKYSHSNYLHFRHGYSNVTSIDENTSWILSIQPMSAPGTKSTVGMPE